MYSIGVAAECSRWSRRTSEGSSSHMWVTTSDGIPSSYVTGNHNSGAFYSLGVAACVFFLQSRSSNIGYSNGLFVHRSIGETHSEYSARDIYGVALYVIVTVEVCKLGYSGIHFPVLYDGCPQMLVNYHGSSMDIGVACDSFLLVEEFKHIWFTQLCSR